MNNEALHTSMFWVGALFAFTPIVVGGGVIAAWWWMKKRDEGRGTRDEEQTRSAQARRQTEISR
ncbi:MAG TPA: hypothetical protein VMM18_13210 [Gemmatimonadaceae bacterium]|nr:hypothetical protein [Gemmatimonadaceae bacterium]